MGGRFWFFVNLFGDNVGGDYVGVDFGWCWWVECCGGDVGLFVGMFCIGDVCLLKFVGGSVVVNLLMVIFGMGGECVGLDYWRWLW